ncbi:transposase [Paenibacillus eucommiae]|uniref:Transposase n=1 Tax=Paenibacillus eucommiae TaxID=1355755 RepID=A0ABS4J8V6_9BACL|nr:transposase [Paenibacillus eucommiae]
MKDERLTKTVISKYVEKGSTSISLATRPECGNSRRPTPRLFSLEDLLKMSPKNTYGYLFETLDMNPFLLAVSKKAFLGAPTRLNYTAMLQSLFIRIVVRIPTIKDLRKRLKRSVEFSTDCGFTESDRKPSHSSYTRLIQKLHHSEVFQQSQEALVQQAFLEGFIDASEGASFMHIFIRVMVPLSKLVYATIGLFAAVNYWNDWFTGLFFVKKQYLLPLQSLLQKVMNETDMISKFGLMLGTNKAAQTVTPYSIKLAIVVISVTPIVAVYPFL